MSDHWNQPEGKFRPSLHTNVKGRERELRSLADGVRRLVRFVTNHSASKHVTADAAREVHALADSLLDHLPDTPPSRYDFEGMPSETHDFFPYDPVLGLYNPLALPVEMEWHEPKAVGRAYFDTPYEGPPGCVHGAILAGVFDQILNAANMHEGCPGPTAKLTLEYRRPTPLHRELVFEAWVAWRENKKVTTRGQVSCDGEVCVEAEGLFIALDFERIQGLARETPERDGS
jgi:hypothetical protein